LEEKKFKKRLKYLKYYNLNDVKIIHSPINNLIKMLFIYGVYMLANFSFASLAQCIKYKLFHDDNCPTFPIKYTNIPIFPYRKNRLLNKKKKKN
jgi:hypothetical protein